VRLGVIPTLAPYLLPMFIEEVLEKYPLLNISIKEMPTKTLIENLKTNQCDIGLLATPLNESVLTEYPVFYEEFMAYSSSMKDYTRKSFLLPADIDIHKLWLLEEGHCFRNQVLNFCELKKADVLSRRLEYEAGSIETLINFVDKNKGITIIPYLATLNFRKEQLQKLKQFSDPKPVREISLVVNKNFPRIKVVESLKNDILRNIPWKNEEGNRKVVSI
jgi:LysR family hydrogen peroxide-inducible transcriptional activator